MLRNFVILADGTGQQGGLAPDELESNFYKLYHGTRGGPGSNIEPAQQIAFYDPGIGTTPSGKLSGWRDVYDLFCQATGIGLTDKIIDCYTDIITNWKPGDRVFLFGFSRGAYTVRCVATVMRLCGLPTRAGDGASIADHRGIATEAVKEVYQYVLSSREPKEYVDQRDELARLFRERYGSDEEGESNAYPHFIGVFDTVASLGNREFVAISLAVAISLLLGLGALLAWATGNWWWFIFIPAGFLLIIAVLYLFSHTKVARGLKAYPLWRTFHLGPARNALYDESLTENVKFARQALSIDESRASFDRVRWGQKGAWKAEWLEQLWFAGNHSDIGGGYLVDRL
jgi:uncharacterized protein (DUF2235 family)